MPRRAERSRCGLPRDADAAAESGWRRRAAGATLGNVLRAHRSLGQWSVAGENDMVKTKLREEKSSDCRALLFCMRSSSKYMYMVLLLLQYFYLHMIIIIMIYISI